MRAPRVLVLGSVLGQPPGGVRRHNAELLPRVAELLSERGGELLVLEGRERMAFTLPDCVQVLRSDIPSHPPLARVRAENRLLGALAHGSCDLVHGAHLPLAGRHALPCTLLIHDLRRLDPSFGSWVQRWFARTVLSRALSRARGVAVVSEAMRTELAQRMSIPSERIAVIPNAADHLPVLARCPTEQAGLITLGHLEPRKNLELLLRALAVDAGLPPLEIHGAEKGNEGARLKSLALELGIADRVKFCGPIAEEALPQLYARAAAAVFPARIEGFGIGALEAAQAGCPVAVSAIAAHREIVPQAPCFDPADARDCARAIRRAMHSAAEAARSGPLNARRFSWDRSAAALADFWCRVHADSARSRS